MNKIFFEVIAFSILTLMGIIVSYQANRIAETQTYLTKKGMLPQIELRTSHEPDTVKPFVNTRYYIFNRGGQLSDFNISVDSRLMFISTGIKDVDTISLVVYNYWDLQTTLTGDSQGLLATFTNGHNSMHEQKLRSELINLGYFSIETFLQISYKNTIDDDIKTEYYQHGNNRTKLSRAEWDKANEELAFAKVKLSFQDIKADTIVSLLKVKRAFKQ
ncbi:hypothetical protein VRU48_08065 [Pedobacter sp. KR3-3]|uniref:DUF4230 domain-containing protein n=1 Tax=Pedobacter albus TaxID=3113905 RepID=A0ABU7I6F0_9SPHI|nr:hypothetical protein [Pedobacter sp. KR3-3]MEE1945058.1 hypothetical protein [Pedobacter sp. KR3-3]